MEWPQPVDAADILRMDEGRLWASVSYCAGKPQWIEMHGPKPITRHIYTTQREAYDAKARIDWGGCGGGCEEWHAVEEALPKEKAKKWYDIERRSYERYGCMIPENFLLPDERKKQEQRREHGIPVKPKERSKRGVVYLLEMEGFDPIKIGHGAKAMTRLKQFQVGTPALLSILREIPSEDHARLEKMLHKRYDAYNVRGEWFALPPTC